MQPAHSLPLLLPAAGEAIAAAHLARRAAPTTPIPPSRARTMMLLRSGDDALHAPRELSP
jgi:hypothetical protein